MSARNSRSKNLSRACTVALGCLVASTVMAQSAHARTATAAEGAVQASVQAGVQGNARKSAAIVAFEPMADPIAHKIDYSIWDEALDNLVISMGPSLRQTAGTPRQSFGTRRQYGHTSRYRLEGTRIMFSFLDTDIIESFGIYRRDLEETADKVDIQSLARNEQLAYWLNLHNVAMIEQIAKEWPVRQPRTLEVGGVPLDDAKFITVEGIALSLRDIRERIVYANWRDPMVMYGFWRGEIGGPSIQREAFNADNVARLLQKSARDFVNSLRGTQKRGDTLQVAELFAEAAPYYFDDFNADLRTHIAQYADDDTKAILSATDDVEATVREYDIADLAGGLREPTYQNISNALGIPQSFRIPQSMTVLLAQRQQKFERIMREGRTGTVTFSNITLPGDEGGVGEVE